MMYKKHVLGCIVIIIITPRGSCIIYHSIEGEKHALYKRDVRDLNPKLCIWFENIKSDWPHYYYDYCHYCYYNCLKT